MNGFRDVCSSSGSVMIGLRAEEEEEEENTALSSEDSSCPEESVSGTELDLALGLSIGLKSPRNYSKVRSSSSSLSSSSSSLTRESGTKRSAYPSASASNSTRQVALGWPPIRTYRINNLVNQTKSLASEVNLSSDLRKDTTDNGVVAPKNDDAGLNKSTNTSMLVKVTVDGVLIGRKVDLSALDSYEALTNTLEHMFFQIPSSATRLDTQGCNTIKASESLDGSSRYIITYQDKEEDWMLVGDVPWQLFLGSVKRLRIMRTSGETGVGE